MKLEKINQWYHLPASLVNTIPASYKIFQQLVISHCVVVEKKSNILLFLFMYGLNIE